LNDNFIYSQSFNLCQSLPAFSQNWRMITIDDIIILIIILALIFGLSGIMYWYDFNAKVQEEDLREKRYNVS